MELRYRLVRQVIGRAVDKAMEDMVKNTGRGIRKLIDLGQMFALSDNQKWFFDKAQDIVSNPKNSYNRLTARILDEVDGETLKTIGLNLGYTSLVYGARKLQKQQELWGGLLPWILIFDVPDGLVPDTEKIEKMIREGQNAGVYSYFFRLHDSESASPLSKIAERNEECFFAFRMSSRLITENTAEILGRLHNTAVCVEMPDAGFSEKGCEKAFRLLRKHRCFYGFHTIYQDESRKTLASPGYLGEAASAGCVFGIFRAHEGTLNSSRDEVYRFVMKERSGNGLPVVGIEWERDLEDVSRRIHVPGGCRLIHLTP